MRLLVIGHSYVASFNQKKYAVMKRLNPSLELKIVAPPAVKDAYRRYEHDICPGLGPDEALKMKTFFYYSGMTYLLDPVALVKLLTRFKPDLIHIEEDPHSLVAAETVLIAAICCPRTAIGFFIWDNVNRKPRFPLNVIKHLLARLALGRAAYVVAGNRDAQALLSSQKNYHGPSFVLPQFGIDCANYEGPARAEIAQRLPKQGGTCTIGFVGRLVPEKGILLLCEALDGLRSPGWKLAVVAAGPLEKVLRDAWKPKFGDQLQLMGAGARADLPDYLKCLDILAVPSFQTPFWKEQFGYILVEAMAAGVAIVASSSGAIPEVVGEAGILVPEGDAGRLREALSLLVPSAEKRKELAALGRVRAREQFSHEVISSSYMKIFQRFSVN